MKKLVLFILLFTTAVGFSQTIVNYTRILRSNFGSQTMWDGVVVDIYGITGSLAASPVIPAPTIYCNEGDSVVVDVKSVSQLHHHTMHLHGLDVDTRNDGDPATSFELEHMQDTTYSFKANNAGTYIYHCHVGDVVHVQMGMYGTIIVRAAGGANTSWTGGPSFNKEYNFLTSEIDRSWHDTVPVHDTITDYITLPKYLPDYFLVNGKSEWQLDADSSLRVEGAENDFIYLRLTNIGFYDNLYVFPPSLQAQVIDSDGRPLPVAFYSNSILVSPGERYGIMLNPNAQLTDSIYLAYNNLNSGQTENVQYIDVNINGYSSLDENISNWVDLYPNNWVDLYPNPANSFVNLEIKDQEVQDAYLSIKNILGQVVYKMPIYVNSTSIEVSGLSTGFYVFDISLGKKTLSKKIIVY